MFNWKKIVSVCLAGAAFYGFAADEKLQLDAKQFEAKYKAFVEWKDDVLTLKIHNPEWAGGVKINPPEGQKFDFSKARYLACDVENLSKDRQMRLTMHISSGERGNNSSSHVDLPHREANTGLGLNPGEKRTMRIYLPHAELFRAPGNGKNLRVLDTAKINSIDFQLQWAFEAPQKYLVDCKISNFRLEGEPEYDKKIAGSDNYFPFIDRYGQYMHTNWPEKIHKDEDLVAEHKRELAELDKTPAPAAWDKYGGWAAGPQLEATGSFRVEKYEGKWFFVDPEGRLFWSLGIDVMQPHTDATTRNHPEWFAEDVPNQHNLPFTEWNLQKKYGKKNYAADFYSTLERRMSAWGINTIGNWGRMDFMLRGNKPYTMSLGEMPKGFPRFKDPKVKFYDVYAPDFEEKMGNILRDLAQTNPLAKKSLTDPMCIGYFIDNELKFGSIIAATVKSDPDQPAKMEFLRSLKEKYSSIDELNKSWDTSFADWEALAANREEPKSKPYLKDARAFEAKFYDRYFEMCRQGVKSIAPNRLYLGCRFVGFRQGDSIWKAAAKYCDVISVNTYTNSIANIIAKNFQDKPVIVGEFHFGVIDRGMFMPGLAPTANQQERAVAFTRYVQGALNLPNLVGVHWFQFRDQPLTGRWDGEGYQIGFVDVADTPYPELCQAAREVGENMYQYRLNGKFSNSMKGAQ